MTNQLTFRREHNDLPDWLTVVRGASPLVVSLPHTGTDLPEEIASDLVSPWLAHKDCDWWIDKLYDFARDLGATVIRTSISRTVVDVNRDPSGVSLYPGQATTDLCPTTTFDGEQLYRPGRAPDVALRRARWFDPYHAALTTEIAAIVDRYSVAVVYDCHSIRSLIPRLFPGELPNFNIGTNDGLGCATELQRQVETICDATPFSRVSNGRFRGGYITRNYGRPDKGVHVVQMELACRTYMREPPDPEPSNWPTPYDVEYAAPARAVLLQVLQSCLAFARKSA